jgi:hypothetical protein
MVCGGLEDWEGGGFLLVLLVLLFLLVAFEQLLGQAASRRPLIGTPEGVPLSKTDRALRDGPP